MRRARQRHQGDGEPPAEIADEENERDNYRAEGGRRECPSKRVRDPDEGSGNGGCLGIVGFDEDRREEEEEGQEEGHEIGLPKGEARHVWVLGEGYGKRKAMCVSHQYDYIALL